MSLSIGIVGGGWHDGLPIIGNMLQSILDFVADERENMAIDKEPMVNVVFHLPGDVSANEHTGIRTGSFSKKERAMMVQVGVPEEVMSSKDPTNYVFKGIRDSIDAAIPRFKKQGWEFSREDHMKFVDKIEQMIRSGKRTQW